MRPKAIAFGRVFFLCGVPLWVVPVAQSTRGDAPKFTGLIVPGYCRLLRSVRNPKNRFAGDFLPCQNCDSGQ
jgi:hypothetical protein